MSEFKLLGIIPLAGCNEKFRKNLIIGLPYKFTDNVTIELNRDNSEIEKVTKGKQNNTKNLYKLNNGINIEISAIVGLNGSGKSALIELLYYLIYAISIHNDKEVLLEEYSKQIDYKISKLKKDSEKVYFPKKSTSSINLFKVYKENELSLGKKDFQGITSGQTLIKNALRKRSEFLHEQKNDDKKNENLIKEELSVSIVYETSEGLYSVSYSDEKLKHYKYNSKGESEYIDNFFFEPFFYSICLNYSHHSLNSKVIGNWINSLFHKNDGYKTPLVINPMREEGNFNINRELHLSNERVMSNLTFEIANKSEVSLLGKYDLKKFLFSTKKDFVLITCDGFYDENRDLKQSNTKSYNKEDFDKLKSVMLVRSKLGNVECLTRYTNYQDFALGYIEKKIEKIKNNYSYLFNDKKLNHNHNKFMAFLRKDKSHITKKLRQTINFIKSTNNPLSIWNKRNHHSYVEFDREKFRSWLTECNPNYQKLSASALMEFALPGFFNIDFDLSIKNNSTKKPIRLSDLSSGEQQMIFNINTITYHLYNLQSVHSDENDKINEKDENEVIRFPYKNISIILDEIEIYYHPDMQRELTSNILNALENIKEKGETGIESIHLIYLTHSPFILSDISSSNILRLNNGEIKTVEQQTFGANIHDLLADNFFMENGLIGEFAKKKLEKLISYLKYNKYKEEFNSNSALKLIELVSDKIIASRLKDLYEERFGNTIEYKRIRRNELIAELSDINEELGHD